MSWRRTARPWSLRGWWWCSCGTSCGQITARWSSSFTIRTGMRTDCCWSIVVFDPGESCGPSLGRYRPHRLECTSMYRLTWAGSKCPDLKFCPPPSTCFGPRILVPSQGSESEWSSFSAKGFIRIFKTLSAQYTDRLTTLRATRAGTQLRFRNSCPGNVPLCTRTIAPFQSKTDSSAMDSVFLNP